MIATLPEANYNAYILLPLIGVFLIFEPRVKLFSSRRGQIISIALKLLLSYLLIGWTHAINSYYYPIFLIPVISAATTFELVGVITVTAIACLAYFSFLLPIFVDWSILPAGRDQSHGFTRIVLRDRGVPCLRAGEGETE